MYLSLLVDKQVELKKVVSQIQSLVRKASISLSLAHHLLFFTVVQAVGQSLKEDIDVLARVLPMNAVRGFVS